MRWDGAEDVDLVIVFILDHEIAVVVTSIRDAIGSIEAGRMQAEHRQHLPLPRNKKERRK
jgi:hypothetical protein